MDGNNFAMNATPESSSNPVIPMFDFQLQNQVPTDHSISFNNQPFDLLGLIESNKQPQTVDTFSFTSNAQNTNTAPVVDDTEADFTGNYTTVPHENSYLLL